MTRAAGSLRRGLPLAPAGPAALMVLMALIGCGADSRSAGSSEAPVQPRLVIQSGHGGGLLGAAISADQRWMVTTDESGAKLWRMDTGQELRRFDSGSSFAAISSDGSFLLTGGGPARVWDSATGTVLLALDGWGDVAISPDDDLLVTCHPDGGASVWDAATGEELSSFHFESEDEIVEIVDFSAAGGLVALAGSAGTLALWDLESGAVRTIDTGAVNVVEVELSANARRVGVVVWEGDLRTEVGRIWEVESLLELPRVGKPRSIALSPDGTQAVTAGMDDVLRLWEVDSGRLVREFEGHTHEVWQVEFYPDGSRVVSASYDASARVWDVASGREVQRLTGVGSEIYAAAFTPDGKSFVTSGRDGQPRQWDLGAGAVARAFVGHERFAETIAFSADSRLLLTGGRSEDEAILWDAETGQVRRRLPIESVNSEVRLTPDGSRALVTDLHRVRVFDTESGEELAGFGAGTDEIREAELSADGGRLLTSQPDYGVGVARLRLWNLKGAVGTQLWTAELPTTAGASLAISADGRRLAVGLWDGPVVILDENGEEITRLTGHQRFASALAFSPDGRRLASGGLETTIRLWDIESGEPLLELAGHDEEVRALDFAPDGRTLLSASADTSVALWDPADGRMLARLVSFSDGTWVVVDEVGRFDTNNLDEIRGIHWVAPDDPFRPLPLEIYLGDYYEPRLLPRLLSGDPLPGRAYISELNRVPPELAIVAIEPEADDPTRVRVTVEATSVPGRRLHPEDAEPAASGVFDLHLFRDGQWVGLAPEAGGDLTIATGETRRVVFDRIQLPLDGRDEVEFSAYAFNRDRVKSVNVRRDYTLAGDLPRRRGRAYVISLGVNEYEHPRWNLDFAVNDARAMQSMVPAGLQRLGNHDEVVAIALYSEAGGRLATKENLKQALDRLAGRPVSGSAGDTIANVDRLEPARPEDLVMITFSGHGHAGDGGEFYFLLSDIGDNGEVNADLIARAVSSEELSGWLRDVDAGDMALVIDACHSASSVEGAGFKPGPMGSRGLGQLSYNKKMMILAASQADDVALELSQIAHGLLSFALAQEGLAGGRADTTPPNGRIGLREWLTYGVARVPTLFDDVQQGRLAELSISTRGSVAVGEIEPARVAQQPSLFDFRRGREPALVWVRENPQPEP